MYEYVGNILTEEQAEAKMEEYGKTDKHTYFMCLGPGEVIEGFASGAAEIIALTSAPGECLGRSRGLIAGAQPRSLTSALGVASGAAEVITSNPGGCLGRSRGH